ncbi:MAG: chorismate synthase, partial [Desulfuromonadales bacterium]|nr:chorismate synthase [Desulfuromonadales bacterium]
MSSTFGTLFKVTTFGESHCPGVGAVVDGCPPGLELRPEDIQRQLDRRRPGQSKMATDRQEADQVSILSGIEFDRTLGTPIALLVANKDQRPGDYGEMARVPRPSHADYTYEMKYGLRAASGGGRASARETIGRVAAGAIAELWLRQQFGIEIVAWVSAVGGIEAGEVDSDTVSREQVDANPV